MSAPPRLVEGDRHTDDAHAVPGTALNKPKRFFSLKIDKNVLSDPHLGSPGCIKDKASFLEAPTTCPRFWGPASDGEKTKTTMKGSPPLENAHSSQVGREIDDRNTA